MYVRSQAGADKLEDGMKGAAWVLVMCCFLNQHCHVLCSVCKCSTDYIPMIYASFYVHL